jgi:putative cross-wall-targeting lipoprotein signal
MKQNLKYGFRKSKVARSLCGAVLGAAAIVSLGAVSASADEVSEHPESLATESTVKVESKADVNTAEVDQSGLDKKYDELQTVAKDKNIEVTEGETVNHKDAKDASEDLNKQGKELAELAQVRDQVNAKLEKSVDEAKKVGVTADFAPTVTYKNLKEAEADVDQQVQNIDALAKQVEEAKARLASANNEAKAAGVRFEGQTVISLAKGEEKELETKIAAAEAALKDLAAKQKAMNTAFGNMVSASEKAGLKVKFSGENVVDEKDSQAALKTIQDKLEAAKADLAKVKTNNASLVKANENAKSVLSKDSTAKVEGDAYKQSLKVTTNAENSTGKVSIESTSNVDVFYVDVISPSGKKVDSVKTIADLTKLTSFSERGTYTVNYLFRTKDNKVGSVKGEISIQDKAAKNGATKAEMKFTLKAGTESKTETKLRQILMPIDGSGSTNGGTSEPVLQDLESAINAMVDGEQVMLAFYETNNVGSYYTMGADDRDRPVSRLMTKAEALSVLQKVKPNKDNNFMGGNWYQELYKAKLLYDFQGKKGSYEIEELFDKVRDKNKTAVVIQLTDSWIPGEDIDGSIVSWAKKNAHTFMSVIYGGADSLANQSMVKAGHPNIYLAKPNGVLVPNDVRSKKIQEQIKATTIETVTKKQNLVAKVTIGGSGVTVTKATLKGAVNKELPIKDGKVEFSEQLPDGDYTVEVELSGNGTANLKAVVDGKEVFNRNVDLKAEAGVKGSTVSVIDKFEPVTPQKLQDETKEVTIPKLLLKSKEYALGEVKTEVHKISVSKEIHKVKLESKPKENKAARKALPKTSAVPGSNVAKPDSSAQLALVAAASVVSYAARYGYTRKRKNN